MTVEHIKQLMDACYLAKRARDMLPPLPDPEVSKLIQKEMEAQGYLQKQVSAEDGRVTYLQLTAAGEQLSREYDADYFRALAPALDGISDADAVCTVRTLEAFYQVMYERRNTLEK